MGYVLQPGFTLPPLMFTREEIEALVLGSRWVSKRGDARLGAAAENALTKIAAVLPHDLRSALDDSALLVGPPDDSPSGKVELALIRQAIRTERRLGITYQDLKGKPSSREIWPFALGYFDRVHILIAWCELRHEFRHFRTDRIASLEIREERYPRRRQTLLKEWRASEGIPSPK